jgi:hypothetical protein
MALAIGDGFAGQESWQGAPLTAQKEEILSPDRPGISDNGKPVERRGRKATRLTRERSRHASRAAEERMERCQRSSIIEVTRLLARLAVR